jgi:Spy/CpxP family protein refolding chaperone
MTDRMKTAVGVAGVVVAILAANGTLVSGQGRRAQDPAPAAQRPLAQAGVSPAEIQRMFDASALLQAQEQLQIRDDQFPQFLMRFKALQDARRQALTERGRIVQQLRRILNAGPAPDEAAVKEQLKALQDLEQRQVADAAKAYEAIDQILDVRQRAQLRVFEEVMERQKLELVMRARQANRPRQQF